MKLNDLLKHKVLWPLNTKCSGHEDWPEGPCETMRVGDGGVSEQSEA